MGIALNSNIQSLQTQRALSRATDALSVNYTRLSSGLRINRASDDAAGLAVADSLRNQARLFGSAARNINDGLSALNIASGTVDNQTSILQRMLELAEQSANGTYSSIQRESMQREYAQLVREFGRQGDTTSFNGLNLLLSGRGGGNPESLLLQIGINGGSAARLSVALQDSGTLSGVIAESRAYGSGIFLADDYSEYSTEAVLNRHSGRVIRTSIVDNSGRTRDLLVGFYYTEFSNEYVAEIYERGTDVGGAGYDLGNGPLSGNSGTWVKMGESQFNVNASTGKVTGSGMISTNLAFDQGTVSGTMNLDLRGLTFLSRLDPSGALQILNRTSNDGISSIDFTGVETAASARTALDVLNNRLREMSDLQGRIGAAQSRLESALNLVHSSRENTTAAESRIRDVDVASESAHLAANQIKQQVASAVLGQANTQPLLALTLLSNGI